MVVLLLFFLCLAVTFRGTCDTTTSSCSASEISELTELRKMVNIRGTNLLEDFRERKTAIFEPFPSKCFARVEKNCAEAGPISELYRGRADIFRKCLCFVQM